MPGEKFALDAQAFLSGTNSADAIRARLLALVPWYRRFLAPWLPADKDTPLLDVPCGPGNLLFALRELGYSNVVGYDADAGQIRAAHALGLPAVHSDAFEALDACTPGSIARVFSLDFLEHVEPDRALEFCQASRRVLTDGGFLLLRTPSADGPFGSHDRYNDVTHRWAMTFESARALLAMAGFSPSSIQVLQEAPVMYKWSNWPRRLLFEVTTRAWGAYLEVAGIGAPKVWTRSMWIVAAK